ncbi:MAG: trehalose-phosphatase [Candidatus Odinarchaeia archaeon]
MKNQHNNHLLKNLNIILKRIHKAKRVFLFLDYDGTLVDIVSKPWLAKPTGELIELLNSIAEIKKVIIILVTGRAIESIKKLIPLKNVIYSGDHGVNIDYPDGSKFTWSNALKTQPVIKTILAELKEIFGNDERIILEDKNTNLSVHLRLISDPQEYKQIVDLIFNLVKKNNADNLIEIFEGFKIIEIRPKGWNKGKVVEIIGKSMNLTLNDIVFFFGDDVTDEDGFKILRPSDISVYIKNDKEHKTNAKYYLNNPQEVVDFLKTLLIELK